jgi:hypothetical protein
MAEPINPLEEWHVRSVVVTEDETRRIDPDGPHGTKLGKPWDTPVWVGWAMTLAADRGLVADDADVKSEYLEILIHAGHHARHQCPYPYQSGAIRKAKSDLKSRHGDWFGVRSWFRAYVRLRWSEEFPGEDDIRTRLDHVLERVAEETAIPEAREFRDALKYKLFAASLLHLGLLGQPRSFARGSVQTYFRPPDFPTLDRWDEVYAAIQTSLDPRLKSEIDAYLDRVRERVVDGRLEPPPGVDPEEWRPLGSNALRTVTTSIHEEMDDYMGWGSETHIRPLRVEFGPTDWHRIQGFCNRMGKDPEFRRLALSTDTNWVRDALPPAQTGRVPSFVAVHATLTGGIGKDTYLVLVQRPPHVHYYRLHWEGTMAENFMGPRKVTRDGIDEISPGDPSLHKCLLRGIEEEFCLLEEDLSEVVLTGFFAESPFASVVAMFRVHTPLSFNALRVRMSSRRDPRDPDKSAVPLEANVVAREPLTVENLVRLVLAPAYAARGLDGGTYAARSAPEEGRDFFVVGGQTGPMGFHPATSARILQLLLSDHHRFPVERVVAAFESELDALGALETGAAA